MKAPNGHIEIPKEVHIIKSSIKLQTNGMNMDLKQDSYDIECKLALQPTLQAQITPIPLRLTTTARPNTKTEIPQNPTLAKPHTWVQIPRDKTKYPSDVQMIETEHKRMPILEEECRPKKRQSVPHEDTPKACQMVEAAR